MAEPLVSSHGVVLARIESLPAQTLSAPTFFAHDGLPPGADADHHRLVWLRGSAQIHLRTGARTFPMQPSGAVWVRSTDALEVCGRGSAAAALFVAETCPPTWTQTVHLGVDPAITALLDWLPAQWDEAWAPAVASAVTQQLAFAHAGRPVSMPVPADPMIRRVVSALLSDPSDRRDVEAWAQYAGYSVRTFRRRFAAATGSSFAAWRSEMRIRSAISMLTAGSTVDQVAGRCGYRSTTAFARAFKEATSLAPSSFIEREPQIVSELRDAWPNMRDLLGEGDQVIRTSPDLTAFSSRAAALAASGLLLLSAACSSDSDSAASSSSDSVSASEPDAAPDDAGVDSVDDGAAPSDASASETSADTDAPPAGDEASTDEPAASEERAEADAPPYPVTVEHVIGTTTLDGAPERIVALTAGTELASLLALGVQPIAFGGSNVPIEVPWLDAAGATDPSIDVFPFPTEINLELLATYEPDLIIAERGLVNETNLGTVEEIAPTIVVGRTDWRGGLEVVGQATGLVDEADAKIAEIEASFDDLSERVPFAAGRAIDIATVRGDLVYQFTAVDNVFADLLADGGMAPLSSPDGGEFPDVNQLSPEQLGRLDAEGIVVLDLLGTTVVELEENPLWQSLPAVQAGRVEVVTGSDAFAMFVTNALTIPVQLDVLEAALTRFFAE